MKKKQAHTTMVLTQEEIQEEGGKKYACSEVFLGFANGFDTIRHLNNRPFNDWACFYIYRLICYSDPTVYSSKVKTFWREQRGCLSRVDCLMMLHIEG